MRVFITGATGLVGTHLSKSLLDRGDSVIVVSRSTPKAKAKLGQQVEVIEGNPKHQGSWMQALNGCDSVVNLAGEAVVGKHWDEIFKHEIVTSRVETTSNVAKAIQEAAEPPSVFVSASAVGYYGPLDWETPVDESHPPGSDFLADVCKRWEAAANATTVRTVNLRISVVLSPEGGALRKMLTPFRLGLGGPMGDGKQPFPWIHVDDMVGLILWALDNPKVEGPINACAPEAVTNLQFARTLGRVLNRPAFLPVPVFVLKLLFGDGTYVLLGGQRVVPKRAVELGYRYRFPEVEGALRSLV